MNANSSIEEINDSKSESPFSALPELKNKFSSSFNNEDDV